MTDDFQLIDRIGGRRRVEFHGSALCLDQHGAERALRQRQLECIFPGRPGAVEQARGDGLCAARHVGFRCLDPPRLVRDAPECNATGAVALHDGGDGHQCECIRGPVTDLR